MNKNVSIFLEILLKRNVVFH